MAETTPSTPEKTVVVNSNQHCRLWTLTLISLALSGVILALLAAGFICHHFRHHHHHGFGGGEGRFGMAGGRGFGQGFHHFRGGFGGHGMMDGGRGEGMKDDDGMMMGGRGMRHDGFGGGMMGGERGQNGPPDPAKMADRMLNHLSTKLTLTDDEKAKIKPIIQAQADQMQKGREAELQAHEKAMADTKAKIKVLLTPDQQKLLDEMPQPGQRPAEQAKPAGQ